MTVRVSSRPFFQARRGVSVDRAEPCDGLAEKSLCCVNILLSVGFVHATTSFRLMLLREMAFDVAYLRLPCEP